MKVFLVETLDRYTGEPLIDQERFVAATSIGKALDAHAPDPRKGAKFTVEYIGPLHWNEP